MSSASISYGLRRSDRCAGLGYHWISFIYMLGRPPERAPPNARMCFNPNLFGRSGIFIRRRQQASRLRLDKPASWKEWKQKLESIFGRAGRASQLTLIMKQYRRHKILSSKVVGVWRDARQSTTNSSRRGAGTWPRVASAPKRGIGSRPRRALWGGPGVGRTRVLLVQTSLTL